MITRFIDIFKNTLTVAIIVISVAMIVFFLIVFGASQIKNEKKMLNMIFNFNKETLVEKEKCFRLPDVPKIKFCPIDEDRLIVRREK